MSLSSCGRITWFIPVVATGSQQRQPKPPCSIITQLSAHSTCVMTEHITRSSPDLGGRVTSMIEGVTKRLWPFLAIHLSEEDRGLKHSCHHSSGSLGACFDAFPHPTEAPTPMASRPPESYLISGVEARHQPGGEQLKRWGHSEAVALGPPSKLLSL